MDIQLLGPVVAWAAGSQVDLGPPRQRLAFAVLALDAGRPVRLETLIDRLWGEAPPQRARDTAYVYVARLRALLRDMPCVLERRSGGYVLDIDPLRVDVNEFERLVAQARHGDGEAALLRRALALWRAEPLADLAGSWVEQVRQMLRAKRLDAMQLWAAAELRLGNAAAVIAPITEMLAAQPFAESLTALLMRALAAAGRSAEALDHFAALRERLAEELGTDPSAELQQVHRAVLRGHGWQPVAVPAPARPAQLPMDIYGFAGREVEFKQLDEIRDRGVGPLVLITGTPGVGKTAFAVRWGHHNADRFTDGQLFLNLRGFEPSGAPLPPLEALGRLLRGLGVEAQAIPNDLDEAAALYRSVVARRNMLILLDNARDVEQVRPLLPGTPHCMVMVTSRHRLGGLLAREGARLLTLGPLSPLHADGLLVAMLGGERVATDPHAGELARKCVYLPLALRIAAANLAARPDYAIGDYLAQLSRQPGALAALHAEGDEQAAVAAAFDVSYSQLSPRARRMFRLSGLCPGQDFDLHAIAATGGLALEEARGAADELCAAHLLEQDARGRYSSHDLLREYARRRAETDGSQVDGERAARRLVDFYTDATYEASLLFNPKRNRAPRDIEHPPVQPLRFAEREAAIHWHDRERDTFAAVVRLAAGHGWHRAAWHLAEILSQYFSNSRQWSQWLATTVAGLDSARQTGDPEAVVRVLLCLGIVHKQTGDYAGARAVWAEALGEATAAGLRRLATASHINLGGLCVVEGDPAAGARHLRTALAHTEYSSVPKFGAVLRVNYGCALLDLDDFDGAAETFAQARSMAEQAGDATQLCYAHHNLAEVALRRGDPAAARSHAREQLRVAEEISDPLRQAAAWDMLGSAACGDDPAVARAHWQRALQLYRQLRHRLAEPLADWLAQVETLAPEAILALDGARRGQARKMI